MSETQAQQFVRGINESVERMRADMEIAGPRIARNLSYALQGRRACCGATNRHCATPPGAIVDYGTGCERCGHPRSCHAW